MAIDQNEMPQQRRRPPSGASAVVLSGFYEGLEVVLDRDRLVIS
jgi:hypothetical protein